MNDIYTGLIPLKFKFKFMSVGVTTDQKQTSKLSKFFISFERVRVNKCLDIIFCFL